MNRLLAIVWVLRPVGPSLLDVYCYRYAPETKGRSLESIERELFDQGGRAR